MTERFTLTAVLPGTEPAVAEEIRRLGWLPACDWGHVPGVVCKRCGGEGIALDRDEWATEWVPDPDRPHHRAGTWNSVLAVGVLAFRHRDGSRLVTYSPGTGLLERPLDASGHPVYTVADYEAGVPVVKVFGEQTDPWRDPTIIDLGYDGLLGWFGPKFGFLVAASPHTWMLSFDEAHETFAAFRVPGRVPADPGLEFAVAVVRGDKEIRWWALGLTAVGGTEIDVTVLHSGTAPTPPTSE